MPAIERQSTNAISWVDLAARNLEGQIGFYTALMGWEVVTNPESDYRIFTSNGVAVAGVMALTPEMGGMPPVWSVYVCVDDADAVLGQAKESGGTVAQEPFAIDGGGRIAVLLDPAGAALCLFEDGHHRGFGVLDEVGAPCWFDCRSRDAGASVAFYSALFGWTSEPMEGPMDYHVMSHEGQPMCGVLQMSPELFPPAVPSHWAMTLSVADAEQALAQTVEAGGQAFGPVMDTPFGRTANLADPDGAGFVVIDRSTATAG